MYASPHHGLAAIESRRCSINARRHCRHFGPLGFDKATVFRNLTDLTEAGLVSRTELGDHVWRFEIRDPSAPHDEHHPHFVCVDCGSVTCLGDMEFTSASRKRSSEIGRITEILIKGYCSMCQQNG